MAILLLNRNLEEIPTPGLKKHLRNSKLEVPLILACSEYRGRRSRQRIAIPRAEKSGNRLRNQGAGQLRNYSSKSISTLYKYKNYLIPEYLEMDRMNNHL